MYTPEELNNQLKDKITSLQKEEVKRFEHRGSTGLNVIMTNGWCISVYFSSMNERTEFINQLLLKWG